MKPFLFILFVVIFASTQMMASPDCENELKKTYNELILRNIMISPLPKELQFSAHSVPVENIALVLPDATEYGKIAAEEIVSRIHELTGKKIVIHSKTVPGKYNIVVRSEFLKEKLKPEGYRLTPEKNGIKLEGVDRTGVLYAGVTARALFGIKEGTCFFYPATIKDWPDYAERQANGGERCNYREFFQRDPEKNLELFKPFADQLFRAKINVVGPHTWQPFQDAFSPFRTTPDVPENFLRSIRKLNDYLKSRGIKQRVILPIKLGTVQQNSSVPRVKELTKIPYHDIYTSWANEDLHKISARKMLDYAKAAGIWSVSLHPVDAGGIADPELWSMRDDASRKRYPTDEDRARADADLFKIYADIFRESNIMVSYIPYPYVPSIAVPDGIRKYLGLPRGANHESIEQLRRKTLDWGSDLDKKIALEHPFEIREGMREEMKAYLKMFPSRPMIMYIETHAFRYLYDDHPLLSPYFASLGDFFPRFSVIHRCNSCAFNEPFLPAISEYMWNAKAPHHTPWKYVLDSDPARLAFLAEYTCSAFWGVPLAKYLKNAFNSGISLEYALRPREVEERRKISDPIASYSKLNADIIHAAEAFDKARGYIDLQGGFSKVGAYGLAPALFNQYHLIFRGTSIISAAKLAKLQIENAIKSGKFSEAEKCYVQAVDTITKNDASLKKLRSVIGSGPLLIRPEQATGYFRTIPYMLAIEPDTKKLVEDLKVLFGKRFELFYASNLPQWIKNFIKNKPLYCGKLSKNITINGIPEIGEWRDAIPMEHFIGQKEFKIANFPVSISSVYDADRFYFSGYAGRKGLSGYKPQKSWSGESFQIFLSSVQGRIFQLILFPDGKVTKFIVSRNKHGVPVLTDWKDEKIIYRYRVTEKNWSFELSVPLNSMDGDKNNYKAFYAYETRPDAENPNGEYYGSVFADNASFYTDSLYKPLTKISHPLRVAPEISVALNTFSSEQALHGAGTGQNVSFVPEIETHRPLSDVKIFAELFSDKGNAIAESEIAALPFMSSRWASTGKISLMTQELHDGLLLKIRISALAGKDPVNREFYFSIGNKDIIPQGDISENGSFTGPRHGETTCRMTGGSVEFEFKSNGKITGTRTLFHLGTVNEKHPGIMNHDGVSAELYGNILTLSLCNSQYKLRRITTTLKNIGQWNKVKFSWAPSDAKGGLGVFINGEKLDLKESSWGKQTTSEEFKPQFLPPRGIQFNALNTGYSPGFFKIRDIKIDGRDVTKNELKFGVIEQHGLHFPITIK